MQRNASYALRPLPVRMKMRIIKKAFVGQIAVLLIMGMLLLSSCTDGYLLSESGGDESTVMQPQGNMSPSVSLDASNVILPPEACTPEVLSEQLSSVCTVLPCTPEFLEFCNTLTGSEVFYRALAWQLSQNGYSDDLWLTVTGRSYRALDALYHADAQPDNVKIMNDAAGGVANLAFVGDINLDDNQFCMQNATALGKTPSECIDSTLISALNSADIAYANSEFCFSIRGYPLITKRPNYRSHPDNVVLYKTLGLDIVNLANNHVFDYSANALTDTFTTLTDAGITYVGAGENDTEAGTVRYFVVNGLKIAYIAASRAEVYQRTPSAGPEQSGILTAYDPTVFCARIAEAKRNADYVITCIHAGNEKGTALQDEQIALARACADNGADLVVGTHPQKAQGIEYYNGVPIVYSLGNFWYGGENTNCILLSATLGANGVTLNMLPCQFIDGIVYNRAKTVEGAKVIQEINKGSVNAVVDYFGSVKQTESK